MQACRYGHWEVVQTLLIFRSVVCVCACVQIIFFFVISIFIRKQVESFLAVEVRIYKLNESFSRILKVTRVDYLSGRTALHFAAVGGHVRCIRLLVADFIPSAPYEVIGGAGSESSSDSSLDRKHDQLCVVNGYEINKHSMAFIFHYFSILNLLLQCADKVYKQAC